MSTPKQSFRGTRCVSCRKSFPAFVRTAFNLSYTHTDRSEDALLLQTASVFKLPNVRETDVGVLRNWLERRPAERSLHGVESLAWGEQNKRDLIPLCPEAYSDTLAQQLSNPFLPLYHTPLGRHFKPSTDPELGRLWDYKPHNFARAGNVLCILLSFGVPTGSIFALYYVQSQLIRLVMISAFNLLFAIAMVLMTECRRAEVFGATAAFAAVLVVFVGGVNIIQRT